MALIIEDAVARCRCLMNLSGEIRSLPADQLIGQGCQFEEVSEEECVDRKKDEV